MIALVQYFISMFLSWLALFAAPLKNPEVLWILIPTYLNWAFTQLYQEKRGTSWGNAISNSLIPIWVGWDWLRTLFNGLQAGTLAADVQAALQAAIAVALLSYGAFILVQSIRLNRQTQIIGRISVVTYAVVVLTPIYYGMVQVSASLILGIFIFFPLFYFAVEMIDYAVPDPQPLTEDISDGQQAQVTQPASPYAYAPQQQGYYAPQPPAHPFPPQQYMQAYSQYGAAQRRP